MNVIRFDLPAAFRAPGLSLGLSLGLLLGMSLGGCAGALQPVQSPPETTPAPAATPLWQAVTATRDGDWFSLLNQGSEALDWRLRAIDAATDSIVLQTFIWELDTLGQQIQQHLLAAAERGVRVRVLMDDSFILGADGDLLGIDQHPRIDVRTFNPYKRRVSTPSLQEILSAGDFSRLDHRMHNKVMVIDNRIAVVGGRNLAREYFGYHPQDNFRDMEVVVGGPIVRELAQGFDTYWGNPWSFPIAAVAAQSVEGEDQRPAAAQLPQAPDRHRELEATELQNAWVTLAKQALPGSARLLLDKPPQGRPGDDGTEPVQVGRELVAEIDRARQELWLISAYLIPTPVLEEAIERAESRGVRVRILTNSIASNNHLSAHSAYRNHLKQLLIAGTEVHELRADAKDRQRYIVSPVADKSLSLHAKLMLVDNDTVYVGSANMDPRSLNINTEMGLLINSIQLNSALRQRLDPDFSLRNAWRVTLSDAGQLTWQSDDEVLNHQPTHSYMRQLEDWVLSLLPIESEM